MSHWIMLVLRTSRRVSNETGNRGGQELPFSKKASMLWGHRPRIVRKTRTFANREWR